MYNFAALISIWKQMHCIILVLKCTIYLLISEERVSRETDIEEVTKRIAAHEQEYTAKRDEPTVTGV